MRKIAADYQQTQGTLPDIGYAVFSGFLVVMVIVATLLCAAIGFVISAFGLFALALLSVVGPLFVAALLFESTRRSEEHTSELQSLMRTSYAVFCLKKKNK